MGHKEEHSLVVRSALLRKDKGSEIMKILYCVLAAIAIFITGCGQKYGENPQASSISIMNYTFDAKPHALYFDHLPSRVVVCGNSAADTIMALGAGKRIRAVSLTDSTNKKNYQEQLPQAIISGQFLSKEEAVMMEPDLIVGWRRFFDPKQLGDTTEWGKRGVPAYIQEASGPIPSLGNFPPCTIESEKAFITNMGKIFQEESKARHYVEEIDKEIQQAKNEAGGHRPKVLVLEFMGRSIEVFGKSLLTGDILEKMDCDVVEFDSPFISKEELLTVDADVIFLIYHGTQKEGEQMKLKLSEPMYQQIRAVQSGKVYLLSYDRIVAPGIHTAETIRYMRTSIFNQK